MMNDRKRLIHHRRCLCGNDVCSKLQDYLSDEDLRFGWLSIPLIPTATDNRSNSKLRREGFEFVHKRLKVHLKIKDLPTNKTAHIARVHFPQDRLNVFGTRFKWWLNGSHGHNAADKKVRENGKTITFNAPRVALKDIEQLYDSLYSSERKKRRTSRSPKREQEVALQRVLNFATPDVRSSLKKQSRGNVREIVHLSHSELIASHEREIDELKARNAELERRSDEVMDMNLDLRRKLQKANKKKKVLTAVKDGFSRRYEKLQHDWNADKKRHQEQLNSLNEKFRTEVAAGLSLDNLLNKEWHAQPRHKRAAKQYFGFDSLSDFMLHVDTFRDEIHNKKEYEAYAESLRTKVNVAKCRAVYFKARWKKLEGIAVAMLCMRQGFQRKHLREITGWGETKLREVLDYWIPEMGKVGKIMCNFPVSVKFSESVMPTEWKNSPLRDCMLIGDGKDIMKDSPRIHAAIRDFSFSSKVGHPAVRGQSWMLPVGLYCVVTDLVLARCSETELFKTYASRFDFVPATHRLLYDKGLRDLRYATKNLLAICTPSYLQRREVFNEDETMANRELARLRYGVEVGYSRIADFKYLQDRMHHSLMKHANSVWFYRQICCGK